MKFKSFRAVFVLITALALVSCKKNKNEVADTSEIQYSEQVAEIISQVTAGEITPQSRIEILFVDDVVDESAINKAVDNPFDFSPSISGSVIWERSDLLVFTPKNSLQARVNYTGKLNLQKLSEKFKEDKVPDLDLKFYVAGRELSSFKADLELKSPNNPKFLVYRGEVVFNQGVALEEVQKASSFTSGALNWNKENDKTFSFVSEPIERLGESKNYFFKIDKDQLSLAEDFEKIVEVAPLKEMKVIALEKDEQGKYPKLMLKFSDDLDASQQIDGFISSNPQVDFKVQKLGKYVMLDGKFKFGTEYQINIASGLKSRWGTSTKVEERRTMRFADIQPQVEFASDGIFMPTSNNKRLQFLSTNLRRVHVEVKKVFDENIENFFDREELNSVKQRNSEFRQSYVSTVGAIVYNQTLELGDNKNEWLLNELDLSNVLSQYNNGLYLVRVNFNPTDVLVSISGNNLNYIQKKGQIYKPVTISDIGLIAKIHSDDEIRVYATDLKTGKPLQGVNVSRRTYNSTSRGETNANGKATLYGQSYYPIKAEKGGQVTFIEPSNMRWNSSGYDVGGLSTRDLKTRAFIYTERGVYRPGDSVNVSCLIRYSFGTKDNVPAYFSLYNPEGTLVEEITQKGAKDGFYNFSIGTEQNDPTGDWRVQINVGNKYFHHNLKIETVVANRLKVKVSPEMKTILPENKVVDIDVEARYLFGASASGLSYESEVEIFDVRSAFPKYRGYTFFNNYVEFQDIKAKLSAGVLDDNGIAAISWNVPNLANAPSPLKAKITASVSEEGGRPNHAWTFVDVHPFTHYVGVGNEDRYVKLNSKTEIPVVAVDHTGKAVSGRELTYRIYRNDSYWWYQYSSYRDFRLKYKTDKHSYLIEEGTATSASKGGSVPFQPAQKGQYLIEIQDGANGHVSSVFMSAYPWGGIPSSDKNAGTLSLRSKKSTYEVGDQAVITFPSPKTGNILLTVEQGDKIILDKWITPADKEDMSVGVKISESMVPNMYVTVAVLQSHDQTVNDRPMRMFGILPITVIDPSTKQDLVIDMPDELRPKQAFDIDIRAVDGKQTQFTVAVVDEGLLDLTNFKTPDPWKKFFQKVRLEVATYDMFGQVIGANKDDVFKTFSIGGDEDYRESQVDPFKKKKRFKPVCMFQGPTMTDTNGKATVHFEMPNYVGSVRVMVVASKGNTYASEEKTVPVKSDLIVQPTIPRALKPGDEFDIPVNVFATKDKIGATELTINTEGPIEVVGSQSYKHVFDEEGDQMFYFKAKVKSAIGQSKIRIVGKAAAAESVFEADVPVSPSAARVYEQEQKVITPGQTLNFDLPKLGIDGANNARLHLAAFPNMDFLHRLDYLIRYPYGCIEQTTSSVFPQLMLKGILAGNPRLKDKIDENINAGIQRLRSFQLSNGGFSYWPGGGTVSEWGSNYAGQFLIEARKNGYVVPDGMYNGIIRYLERATRNSRDASGTNERYLRMTKINRCYVLALAGKAPLKAMNLIKQNEFDKLNNVQKWMLAASYQLAGAEDQVRDMIDGIGTEVEEYKEFAYTYGSTNRDLGIILRCLVILERESDAALLAKQVAKVLSNQYWYSTQTVGQMLLGIGSYFDKQGIEVSDDVIIEGTVTLSDGTKVVIKTVDDYSLYINSGYGKQITLKLNDDVAVKQLFATVTSNGVPIVDQTKEENKNISLDVDWYDEDGNTISIDNIGQAETFYGHYRVTNTSAVPLVEEVALVQLLPSGWEIENTRLSNEIMPSWMNDWRTDEEDYLDIRDDRIMWFFDLSNGRPLDFVVKINAITTGSYTLPGARCEAMYDNDFVATKEARKVTVSSEE